MSNNRKFNVTNPNQGDYKKVLCVCSAGLLRSPTAAYVLSQEPYNYNTRAVGVNVEYALIPIDLIMFYWADEVVCMEQNHKLMLEHMINSSEYIDRVKDRMKAQIKVLNIPDRFMYRDPELIELIKESYNATLNKN
jgi:predicted protein tyrosine phosphatase